MEGLRCPSTLKNGELARLHDELMECPESVSYWREIDDELSYRCEEGEMEWPYSQPLGVPTNGVTFT